MAVLLKPGLNGTLLCQYCKGLNAISHNSLLRINTLLKGSPFSVATKYNLMHETYFISFTFYQIVLTSLDFLNWRRGRHIRKRLGPIEHHDLGQDTTNPCCLQCENLSKKENIFKRHLSRKKTQDIKGSIEIMVKNRSCHKPFLSKIDNNDNYYIDDDHDD